MQKLLINFRTLQLTLQHIALVPFTLYEQQLAIQITELVHTSYMPSTNDVANNETDILCGSNAVEGSFSEAISIILYLW